MIFNWKIAIAIILTPLIACTDSANDVSYAEMVGAWRCNLGNGQDVIYKTKQEYFEDGTTHFTAIYSFRKGNKKATFDSSYNANWSLNLDTKILREYDFTDINYTYQGSGQPDPLFIEMMDWEMELLDIPLETFIEFKPNNKIKHTYNDDTADYYFCTRA